MRISVFLFIDESSFRVTFPSFFVLDCGTSVWNGSRQDFGVFLWFMHYLFCPVWSLKPPCDLW